jgi:esterase/lipase superfamily enzyme
MLKSFGAIGLALFVSACAVHSPEREFLAVAADRSDAQLAPRSVSLSSIVLDKNRPITLLTASTRGSNSEGFPRAIISKAASYAISKAPRTAMVSYAKQTVDSKGQITKIDVDKDAFLGLLREQLGEGIFTPPGDVMIFVHGFNNIEKEAIARTKLLANATAFNGVPVAFTWPSVGGGWGPRYYLYDLQSSTFSRDELATLLQSLANERVVGRIHLVAHSMGCWLTMETLRQTSLAQRADVLSKVSSITLLAPDIDEDVFDSQIAGIGSLARRITVFGGTDDNALAASAALAAAPRLGNDKITMLRDRYATFGISFFDTTNVKADRLIHHFKGDSPIVAAAIANQIAGGSDAT